MTSLPAFHEVRFPTDIALGATGGPQRRTEIITLGSGQEQRNARWAHSRRRYNAGYGVKSVDELRRVIAFFEERRGRLFGFRFRDPLDWSSSDEGASVTAMDQRIGTGDGETREFQLVKNYGEPETGYTRKISKPVEGSIQIAVDGNPTSQSEFSHDFTTGLISFHAAPAVGTSITAGFHFDVPVRFDTDEISVNLSNFEAGDIPAIGLVELLL